MVRTPLSSQPWPRTCPNSIDSLYEHSLLLSDGIVTDLDLEHLFPGGHVDARYGVDRGGLWDTQRKTSDDLRRARSYLEF